MRVKLLPVLAAAAAAALTLPMAGCGALQKAAASVDGQLFCAKATADGPLIVAVVDTFGAPVLVTNVASALVADFCKTWNPAAVPVSPPSTVAATVAIVKPTS